MEGKAAGFPAHLRHSDGTWYFFTQCPHLSAGNRDDRWDGAWENDGRVSQDSNPGSTANSGLCSHTLCCKQGQERRKARNEWIHVPVTSSLKKSQEGEGEKGLWGIGMGCALKLTMPGRNLHLLPELRGADISLWFMKGNKS